MSSRANHVHELLPGPTNTGLLESLLASLPAPTREEEHRLFEKIWEDALGFGFRERSERGEMSSFIAGRHRPRCSVRNHDRFP